jgi:hypothetical protein
MELAGAYINLMMPGKEEPDYPMAPFTTEYSGPLHEDPRHSTERMKTLGDVKSASVPRNTRSASFASPGSKGSGMTNVNTRRQF